MKLTETGIVLGRVSIGTVASEGTDLVDAGTVETGRYETFVEI